MQIARGVSQKLLLTVSLKPVAAGCGEAIRPISRVVFQSLRLHRVPRVVLRRAVRHPGMQATARGTMRSPVLREAFVATLN